VGDGPSAHGRRVEQLLHAVWFNAREYLLDPDQHAEHAAELLDDRRCHLHDRSERNAHAHLLHHRRLHQQHVGDDAYTFEQRVERFHVLGVVGFEQRHADAIVGQFVLGIDVVERVVLVRIVVERFIQQRVRFDQRVWIVERFRLVERLGLFGFGQQRPKQRHVEWRVLWRQQWHELRRIVGWIERWRIVWWRF
jgi:hypothetical protein